MGKTVLLWFFLLPSYRPGLSVDARVCVLSVFSLCLQVYWVQCDCCNQWFHMVCVGVSAKMAAEEDYMCVTCSTRNMGQRRKWERERRMGECRGLEGQQPVRVPSLPQSFPLYCPVPSCVTDRPQFPKTSDLCNNGAISSISTFFFCWICCSEWCYLVTFCIFTAFSSYLNCVWLSKKKMIMLNEESQWAYSFGFRFCAALLHYRHSDRGNFVQSMLWKTEWKVFSFPGDVCMLNQRHNNAGDTRQTATIFFHQISTVNNKEIKRKLIFLEESTV